MGGMGKGLEAAVRNLARAPYRMLRAYGLPLGISAGIGLAYYGYLAAANQKIPSIEETFNSFWNTASRWETWRDVSIISGAWIAGLYSAVFAVNRKRKKDGKPRIKPLNLLRQALFPWTMSSGEKGFNELIEALPDSSIAHRCLADFYLEKGRKIEAIETYYRAMKVRDMELFPKIPILGTNLYVNALTERIPLLKRKLKKEPKSNEALLELSMNYFLLNDFTNSIRYFEMIDKAQDPVSLHALASRLYSEISKNIGKPKLRRISFGDSRIGRKADSIVFFSRRQKLKKDRLVQKADAETLDSVDAIFKLENLNNYLEQIGDYNVWKVGINSFTRGFVVLKQPRSAEITQEEAYSMLSSEKRHEQIFQETVAEGRFRGVHPDGIAMHNRKHCLMLLYEEGSPLSESRNEKHFSDTLQFAARSDALMPLDYLADREYNPEQHFRRRIAEAGIAESAADTLRENCGFLFKYSGSFPLVFDGDWHPGNCLVSPEEEIIALDKEEKGVTIGPVTAARVLNQGTAFGHSKEPKNNSIKDSMASVFYVDVYQAITDADRRMDEPELFIPATMAATIEKAVTTYCFTREFPKRQESAQVFLRKALNSGLRIRTERAMKRFYTDSERKQCAELEKVIFDDLLATAP